MGVEPKIGQKTVFPPKWMVKIMERFQTPTKLDDLGGGGVEKPPIFGWKHVVLCGIPRVIHR